ncbi:zinc ribbon domain-containing protein [Ligilactobacillus faecis]|uniref:zinc ribbon domain-containing protein n=1 Tax=Ligilactobacillus faecis TaxID=762833 RepID=UPI002468371E|nr:zinc ribbon domain-containing protein [Ligilactobacillus faecis]WGN89917.1 zinc ribbon domain-containing protein [Ligilactobacillus faecis]
MQCPNCGKNNLPNAKFCENCGYSFLKRPKKNTGKVIGFILLGILMLGGAGFLGYKTFGHKEEPVKQLASTKKDSASQKKKSSSSSKQSEASSSSREKASAKAVVTLSSETTTESSSTLPDPVFINGQMSVWKDVNNPDRLLIVNGVTSVQTANIIRDSATTPTHIENTYNVEESSGNRLFISSDQGGSSSEIKVEGDQVVWNNNGTVTRYNLKTIQGTTSSAATQTDTSTDSSEDTDDQNQDDQSNAEQDFYDTDDTTEDE